MKRFVQFSVHEYMDMYPRTEIMVWEGKNEADITAKCKQYAEDLSSAYSGGPTIFKGILDEEEAFNWLKKEIQSIKYPCKEDFEWIKKTIDAINECYTYITDII